MRQTILACAIFAAHSAASAAPAYAFRVFAPGVVGVPIEAPAAPGQLEVSLNAWDFGSLAVGASGSKVFTLANSGGRDVAVSFSNLEAPFSLVDNQCGSSLAPSASCLFTVKYQPVSSTDDIADLSVEGAAGSGLQIELSGRGAPAATAWRSVNLGRHNWYAMAFGAGRFVTLASDQINYSTDGVTWQTIAPPANYSNNFRGMAYGDGKFVGVSMSSSGGPSYSATSIDGISWSVQTMPTGTWWDVAHGNGRFVAIDAAQSAPRTAVSTDGTAWSVRASSTRLKSVAFGNGVFVASTWNTSNQVSVSTDGVTWSTHALPASLIGKVSYVNGRFILMGGTVALTSTNGVTWTQSTLPIDMRSSPPVAYGNGKYIAVAGQNSAGFSITSTDGVNWTTTAIPGADWYTIAFGNGVFVATSYNYSILGYTN